MKRRTDSWVDAWHILDTMARHVADSVVAQRRHRDTQLKLGAELRRLRKKRGLSLRAVAKKLKVSAPFLSDCELGRRYWSAERAEEYLRVISKP